ncbi:hypothetical protein ACFLS7_01680 [Bacteroidota bacterium]
MPSKTLILIICILALSTPLYSQNPDSITVIPMATSKNDTVQPVRKAATGQRVKRPNSFWRRVALGGNIGFQFGTVTGFNISPEVRVRAVDQLYVGVGFIYQYFRVTDYYYDWDNKEFVNYSANTFGGKIFLRYYLRSLFEGWAGDFFAHTEYEYLNYILPFEQDPTGPIEDPYQNRYVKGTDHLEVHSIFVGGGYSQPISNRVFIDLLVMFNLNDSPSSPYTNPVFRLGVGVGL